MPNLAGTDIVGIVVLLAIAAATFLRSRRDTADSATSRAILALQAEIGALKDANHRLEIQVTEYRGKVESLEEHNRELKDMVAARPEWQLLIQTVNKQAETSERIDKLMDQTPSDWLARQKEHFEQTEELHRKLAG